MVSLSLSPRRDNCSINIDQYVNIAIHCAHIMRLILNIPHSVCRVLTNINKTSNIKKLFNITQRAILVHNYMFYSWWSGSQIILALVFVHATKGN